MIKMKCDKCRADDKLLFTINNEILCLRCYMLYHNIIIPNC